jgi:hypothetical protein
MIHLNSAYVIKSATYAGLDRSFRLQEAEAPKSSRQGYQLYMPAAFTPRRYLWQSLVLEAESTSGP